MIMKEKAIYFLTIIALLVMLPSLGEALCVKAPMANLRIGPGTSYSEGRRVNKCTPFIKVGVSLSGDWYTVKDVDGDVFWIKKNLVTDQYRCAAVTAKIANVRTGPGTQHKKAH
jgi:SH3-like domain-containing protein